MVSAERRSVEMLDVCDGVGGPALFGVVRFEPGEGRRVRDVLIPFETLVSAERAAANEGRSDSQACPLRFVVREVSQPAGIRRLFEGELARAAERTRELAGAGDVPAVEPGGRESGGEESAPAVAVVPWSVGEWAAVVRAGSNPAELCRALARLQDGVEFIEPFGDVDIVLVYGVPEAGRAAVVVRELVAGAIGGESGSG
jgi:uncharacterized repeat protein (TIGR03917 family)